MVTSVPGRINLHTVLGYELFVILHASIYSLTQAKIKLTERHHIDHNHCSSAFLFLILKNNLSEICRLREPYEHDFIFVPLSDK